jgi:hypothetical protein
MTSSIASSWPPTQTSFVTRCHGKIRVRQRTTSFGFQIYAANPVPHPSLIFAVSQGSVPGRKAVQFAVKVDLETGEIWDVANDTGVIGWLERDLWPSATENFPLVLRWEIEHTGSALIPRLVIGEEEWLYPSVLFPGESNFAAVTGHNLAGVDSKDVFSPGYVWCQDRLK